ncbi:MAG: hypothetical protein A07HR60_00738 [uncultured archaeon A07HR60]|nr:MAG: hypothetical protein A07HR60_00738 [uncultured archaeon A07HR60]
MSGFCIEGFSAIEDSTGPAHRPAITVDEWVIWRVYSWFNHDRDEINGLAFNRVLQ